MKTIESQDDIIVLVDTFYQKVNKDELLSPIFNKIAKVHWDSHMPTMYAFWGSILLDTGTYSGRPFPKHLSLLIKQEHFDKWLLLFHTNIDEQFSRDLAEEAKTRASTIAQIFISKIKSIKGDL